ncbi:short transient receptor potential channel 2 isoform X2 [Xenopus tropicalis]|nr:short transient receptor potential channel 2 isoform X2 [Xenopus tropicalis]
MAPITVRHIVSFSSQDPKHPVENLLSEISAQPWLISPRERGGHLRAELQLEKACHIAYVDIGNCGSAFLQIDVGRSSWPLDRPYVTLLPSTTLMSPADSKQRRGPNGVRMFKEGDFLVDASAERWDRVRISASQPFNKRDLFGLSFIRFRSALEEEQHEAEGPPPKSEDPKMDRTPDSETPQLTRGTESRRENPPEGEGQKSQNRLPPSRVPPHTANPACLSRTALMVLTAAKSRKRRFADTTPPAPPSPHVLGEKSPVPSGSNPAHTPPTPPQKEARNLLGRRRLRMEGPPGRVRARGPERQAAEMGGPPGRRGHRPRTPRPAGKEQQCSSCPICGGYFQLRYLPSHASTCGEDPPPRVVSLSLSEDSSSSDTDTDIIIPEEAESWVSCPICSFRFPSNEIEIHANTCGE